MTTLVTGGAGYIGSHTVLELANAGENVVVLDNLSTGFPFLLPPEVPLVVGSTGDRELVSRVICEHGVDAIIHFAASIVVPESVRDPLGYYRNNTLNTCNLIDIAIANGVNHAIFSSTAAVYGNAERVPVCEDDATLPISPYGRSKLMSEIMLRDAAFAHGLRYVALRYFNVAGADPHGRTGQTTPRATHLIKAACEAAVGKRPNIDVFGTDYQTPDGTAIRDYIHVSDLASAHSAALGYLRAGGMSATFNAVTVAARR
jgi:UDP-glucose 4-epimerase